MVRQFILSGGVLIYSMFAYVNLELDPFAWSFDVRLGYALALVLNIPLSFILVQIVKAVRKYDKNMGK